MNFTLDISVVKKIMSNLSGILSKDKNSILNNYYISIKDSQLLVVAGNEVIQSSLTFPISSDAEGSFLLKFDFFDRLKFLSGDVVFNLNNDLLTLKNNSFKTTAKILPTDSYPLEDIEGYQPLGSFNTADILELAETHIAASKEEIATREFTGVLIDIHNNHINFVATNRSRLFWINKAVENDLNFYAIIEKDGIQNLIKQLKLNKTENLNILYSEKDGNIVKIAFQFDNIILISKTIQGRFPDYSKVILDDNQDSKYIVFNKQNAEDAITKVLSLSNENELTPLEFSFSDSEAVIKNTNKEGELATDVFTLEEPVSEPFSIMVNGKYALDFLNNTQADSVYFYYRDAFKPVEFKSNNNGIESRYVVTTIK